MTVEGIASSHEKQMAALRQRAVEASRRTGIDFVTSQHRACQEVKVPLGAHIWKENMTPDEMRDRLLASIPDLLTLATYAWYQLQIDHEPPENAESPFPSIDKVKPS